MVDGCYPVWRRQGLEETRWEGGGSADSIFHTHQPARCELGWGRLRKAPLRLHWRGLGKCCACTLPAAGKDAGGPSLILTRPRGQCKDSVVGGLLGSGLTWSQGPGPLFLKGGWQRIAPGKESGQVRMPPLRGSGGCLHGMWLSADLGEVSGNSCYRKAFLFSLGRVSRPLGSSAGQPVSQVVHLSGR